jgi:hypothetical protein
MAAMDASTNGAYDTPIDNANFDFEVAVTGRPYSKYFILVMLAYVPFSSVHRCHVLSEAAGAVKCTIFVFMSNVTVTHISLPNSPSVPSHLSLTLLLSLLLPTYSARIHQLKQQAHELPHQTFYECVRLTVLESPRTRISPYPRLHVPGLQRLPIQETGR